MNRASPFRSWHLVALWLSYFISCCALACAIPLNQANHLQHFPLRNTYPDSITIDHYSLAKNLQSYLIIDVRSKYEYDVLHINNAINIPITNLGFIPKLKSLIKPDNRQIVFYCNGISCRKSYLANMKARKNNIHSVRTFDLGILLWSKCYPNKTSLFGRSPLPPNKLIDKKQFDLHNLSAEDFINKINRNRNSLVIDIREPFQRHGNKLQEISTNIPLNSFYHTLPAIKKQQATLLIFDEVGKQVVWLQYLLEQQNLKNYYFLKGGVEAYLASGLDASPIIR